MTTYFVDSGKPDDTGDGLSWASAKQTIQAALTAASSGADIVVIKSTVDHLAGADLTLTTANSVAIIAATADDTGTAYTPTAMGTANFIGHGSTGYTISFNVGADDKVFCYGLTFKVVGSGTKDIRLNGANFGGDCTYESCQFLLENTASNSIMRIGSGNLAALVNEFYDCVFKFGHASQYLGCGGSLIMHNCSIDTAGTTQTNLFGSYDHCVIKMHGCDWSDLGSNSIIANSTYNQEYIFDRCKLGTSFSILASQTNNPTRHSARAYVFDSFSDDTHLFFGYYDALGTVTNDTSIYFTSTDAEYVNSSNAEAPVSWKIVTSGNATFWDPFKTPWIDLYHTGTSEITPYFEIVRSGSATAYQNDEIWAEFTAKTTSSSTKASATYRDRKGINGATAAADQAAGAGTGSWTGENATSWSGKIDSGSAITPAEKGYIRGRICVGEPSITVYVDPQIRT